MATVVPLIAVIRLINHGELGADFVISNCYKLHHFNCKAEQRHKNTALIKTEMSSKLTLKQH